jgi:hypothetical protein
VTPVGAGEPAVVTAGGPLRASAPWLWCRGAAAASFRARWAVPTIAWRRDGRRDWHRSSQTGAMRSAGRGDLPMTAELLSIP